MAFLGLLFTCYYFVFIPAYIFAYFYDRAQARKRKEEIKKELELLKRKPEYYQLYHQLFEKRAPAEMDANTRIMRLLELREYFEKGLISEDEFRTRRNHLMEKRHNQKSKTRHRTRMSPEGFKMNNDE